MSVYKTTKSRFYHYDFQHKGKRYTGSTGVETMRKAEEVERKVRADAALGLYDDGAAMTLDEAAGRWWAEVGSGLATGKPKAKGKAAPKSLNATRALSDVERRLEILLRLLGPQTRIVDLTTRKISVAIEKRRGETYQKAPDREGKPAKRYPVSNATVNADIIISLRRILTRAEKVWEVKPLPKVDWKALALKEPVAEIRIYTAAQRAAWSEECDTATRFPLRLLLVYGLRLNELFFPPDAYLPDVPEVGPCLAINKRKRGVMLLPLREDDAREIAARVSRAQALGLPSIWYEEEAQPARGRNPRKKAGDPITYYGMQTRITNAATRAGIDMSRVIHGARHHAGTMILAKTKNLKFAQDLLGHADIKSTLRYAHALKADLRAALEDDGTKSPESRNSPGAEKPKRGKRQQGKG